MASKANSAEYLYYKLRAGNPNHPALKSLFPQLDLESQRRVRAFESTVNGDADKMHDTTSNAVTHARQTLKNNSNSHRTMMDKSRVDL